MTCPGCENPTGGLYIAGCRGCEMRAIGRSPAYHASMRAGRIVPEYAEMLRRVLGGTEPAAVLHAEVKALMREIHLQECPA